MTENNETNPEKKGILEQVFDKFKDATQNISEKVENTISEAKNSELGEKLSNSAKDLGEKAQNVINNVKDSEFVDKAEDVASAFVNKTKSMGKDAADFCSEKVKSAIGKINFDKTLENLKEKQESSGKDLSKVINFVEKLQNIK